MEVDDAEGAFDITQNRISVDGPDDWYIYEIVGDKLVINYGEQILVFF